MADYSEYRITQEYRLSELKKKETIMFYALGWLVVFGLLALWSLAAYVFHAFTAWTVSNAGVLAGGTGLTEGLRLPEWLAPWVPAELAAALTSMVAALMPAFEAVLGWAPALAGGLSVAVWVVWAIGSALLIVLGVALSAVIAVFRRRSALPAVRSVRQPRADGQVGRLLETNLRSR
jgi:hypothetical protein